MKKILLSLFVLTFLMGAACSSKVVDEFEKAEDTITEAEEVKDLIKDHNLAITDDEEEYVLYENKAMGYTVMRPDGWYWQHFMKSDIETAGSNELIDDYLIIDKDGLMGLMSEYLGQIVIEKSRISLEDLAKDKDDYITKEITVAGQAATRFEIQTDDKKMIEYHLVKGDVTYRLLYVSNDNEASEAIFEKVVKSFSFVE
ncbi:MAG: hypothetical protein HOE19_03190 [Candidatus Komeilibacteria bacterium]|jgi:hypothetical protein|nr:hypothetical protein [Candidatus Komeilibacteria bacterium]MBT4447682.1 hypothetical protein [Candidatus Komeilibacteria bacterium]